MAKRTENGAKFLNSRYSELNMMFLACNLTTKTVSFFILPLLGKSPLTDTSRGNYVPYITEDNFVKLSNGITTDNLKGDTSDPNSKFTIEIKENLNSYQVETPFGNVRNMFEIGALGSVFKYGSDLYEIVGMNGLISKTGGRPTKCEIGNDWKYLTYSMWSKVRDGQAIDNLGKPITKTNIFTTKPSGEVKSVMFELYIVYNENVTPTTIYPYAYTGDVKQSETDSANTLSAEFTRCSDLFEANDSFIYSLPTTDAVMTTLGKQFLTVDYIIANAGGVAPTDFGVSGATLCLVNTTNGSFTLKTSTGLAWTAEAVGDMIIGGVISSNKNGASTLALANVAPQKSYVAVKTPLANNTGTLANFAYDTTGTVKNYVCKAYVLDQDNETFAPFDASGTICQ